MLLLRFQWLMTTILCCCCIQHINVTYIKVQLNINGARSERDLESITEQVHLLNRFYYYYK